MQKSDGGWRLAVDYRGLNEVTPPLSAAIPDMLELQYELESKTAKWYATIDNCQSIFLDPFGSRVQAIVCSYMVEECPINLEPTAPGVEAQPYHLPWTDPDCTGTG